MKYKDTKPIPRKVAIKNYLLNKSLHQEPQEQNDRVRQILTENKPKIRNIARYLMNSWQKNINANNSNGKVVVSRKNKYFTSKNVVHTANNIDTKEGTIKQGAPYLTKKQDYVATATSEQNNNRPLNVNNGNKQTFGNLRNKYKQIKNALKNKENDIACIKRNFQHENQTQQEERSKYLELYNKLHPQPISDHLFQKAEQSKRSNAEVRLNNELKQIKKDFDNLKQNNGIDGCFNLPKTTIDINLDGQAVNDLAQINSRQSLMSINSFIDGFNLPKTTIDSNRGGQAVDNRAEINSRRSSISKKSRSDCCRVC